MSIKLVDDWRDCWKWYSSHAFLIAAALQGTWMELPPEWKALVPANAIYVVTAIVAVCGFAGRMLEQTRPEHRP